MTAPVLVTTEGSVRVLTLNRPQHRNAIDGATAKALVQAVAEAEADTSVRSIVLTGSGGNFCAGADLKALEAGQGGNEVTSDGEAPLGISRHLCRKPVIAAIEGYAVAGGIELALWADIRIASESAIFGVFCRRFGVPLIDGGTVRLPLIVGLGRALEMILTGRAVGAAEAVAMGLASGPVPVGRALPEALLLAKRLADLPQECMLSDRAAVYAASFAAAAVNADSEAEGVISAQGTVRKALRQEFAFGLKALVSPEFQTGLVNFQKGAGRHGVSRSRL